MYNLLDDKFEQLLRSFITEKLNINPDLLTKPIVGFEILDFIAANKKQFVSTVTKEILFEVYVEGQPTYLSGAYPCNPILVWTEFWRQNE